MEFRILGPLEVHGGSGALPLGTTKPRAVLAVLVPYANEPVSSTCSPSGVIAAGTLLLTHPGALVARAASVRRRPSGRTAPAGSRP